MGGRGSRSGSKSGGGGASAGGGATGAASATGATGAAGVGAAAGGQQAQQPPQQAKQAPQPQQQATQGGKPTINATQLSKSEFMQRYNAQAPNRAQKSASYDYTDPRPTSTGFSPSQNMNYKLDTGQRLTAKEQRMLDGMEQMSKPIGKDIVVHRGAHQNVLEALGVKNYDTMTQAQLQQALVGTRWKTKSLSSTSYDKSASPFLSGPQAGGREVIMKINVAGTTKATMVNPPQAEVVIGRNTNWEIKNVRFTGQRAYPRANYKASGYPVVELEIDVWP